MELLLQISVQHYVAGIFLLFCLIGYVHDSRLNEMDKIFLLCGVYGLLSIFQDFLINSVRGIGVVVPFLATVGLTILALQILRGSKAIRFVASAMIVGFVAYNQIPKAIYALTGDINRLMLIVVVATYLTALLAISKMPIRDE